MEKPEQPAVALRLMLKTLRELTGPKVDIYFTAVGMMDIPTEQEIKAMIQEMEKDSRDFRIVA